MTIGISKVGTEFAVNQYTTNDQIVTSAAAVNGNEYVVVWSSNGQDGSDSGVYGQRYLANGEALGQEFLINTTTSNGQGLGEVAALPFGGFVVSWVSDGQDGSLHGIFAQMYDQNATPVGGEFQVNTTWGNEQFAPQVTGLSGGNFVVTWNSLGQDGDGYGVFGQMFDFWGSAIGGEFQVNTKTASTQSVDNVKALSDGGFIVTYRSEVADSGGFGVVAQRFDQNGTMVGREQLINANEAGDQFAASVAELADGNVLFVYIDNNQDGDSGGIYGRIMDAGNQFLSAEFRLNETTAFDQSYPQVAAMPDGGFVAVWQSLGHDGFGYGIYVRRYDAQGQAIGVAEELVNTTTAGHQSNPVIAVLDSGGFMITWTDDTIESSTDGVRVQFYAAEWIGTDLDDDIDLSSDGLGTDVIYAGDGDDDVNGGELAEVIWGDDGDDVLYGNGGNDELHGGAGFDEIYGGDGKDTLYGDGDNDLMSGGQGRDTLSGGDGDDEIYGDEGRDVLNGDAGNDVISGGNGGDRISGGEGNDEISGGGGVDRIMGGDGDDDLSGDGGADVLNGDAGNDVLSGGTGSDVILGGGGNDEMDGGAGADTLKGGTGHDIVVGGGGADTIYGDAGRDILWGDSGADYLNGGRDRDWLYGGDGADQLFGGSGKDYLDGGSGADLLNGGSGNDKLMSGGGNDTMTGGAGADTFIFKNDDMVDTVTDFVIGDGDKLVFDSNLWIGDKTVAEMISDFAEVDGGTVVFDFTDFYDYDTLILEGVNTLVGLEAVITIVDFA